MARQLVDLPEQRRTIRKRSFCLSAPQFTIKATGFESSSKYSRLDWIPSQAPEGVAHQSTPEPPQDRLVAASDFRPYPAVRSQWPATGLLLLALQQSLHFPIHQGRGLVSNNSSAGSGHHPGLTTPFPFPQRAPVNSKQPADIHEFSALCMHE